MIISKLVKLVASSSRAWIVSFSVLIFLANSSRADFLTDAKIKLDSGEYLIEKIDFLPGIVFQNEAEAKQYDEEFKKNPKPVKPDVRYYKIFVNGNDFVLHALKKGEGTNFLSNNNFFVSITTSNNSPWFFEEAANRVTFVSNYVENPNLNTPYTTLLNSGRFWVNDLRTLGVGLVDWRSAIIDQDGNFLGQYSDTNFFIATTGGKFSGTVRKDSAGRMTNVFCGGTTLDFDRNYDIYYDATTGLPSRVLMSSRDKGTTNWNKEIQYTLVQSSPLAPYFNMNKYWQNFTNEETHLVNYDLKQDDVISVMQNGKSLKIFKANPANVGTIGENGR